MDRYWLHGDCHAEQVECLLLEIGGNGHPIEGGQVTLGLDRVLGECRQVIEESSETVDGFSGWHARAGGRLDGRP